METTKDKVILGLGLALLVFMLLTFKHCSSEKDLRNEQKQYELNIVALNDSIKIIHTKDGKVVFQDDAVVSDPSELVKTEAFKQLSKEKQKFYLDLVKTKGLLASAQATIMQQGEQITVLKNASAIVSQTESTITLNKKDSLCFDTTKNSLTYSAHLKFNKSKPFLDFKYSQQLSVLATFKRQPDKSIVVNHQFSDTTIKVLSGQSLIIPFEDNRTKWQKFVEKAAKVGIVILPPVFFIGGVYYGLRLK